MLILLLYVGMCIRLIFLKCDCVLLICMLYVFMCLILMSVVYIYIYMCVSLFGLLFILCFSMVSMVYVLLLSEVGGSVEDTVFNIFEAALACLYCVILVFGVCV